MRIGRIALALLAAGSAGSADSGRRSDSPSYFPVPIQRNRTFEGIAWEPLYFSEDVPLGARITEIVDGEVMTRTLTKDGIPTLSLGSFLFRVTEHEVRILMRDHLGHYFQRAAFKKSLKAGMKWTAKEVAAWDGLTTLDREYSVTPEQLRIPAGTFETLRIDVRSERGRPESLWLARGVGLVRWDTGCTPTPLQWTGFTLRNPRPAPTPVPLPQFEDLDFLPW